MKKFFLMLGAWGVAVIVIIAGSSIYEQSQSSEFDDRAIPYIQTVIPELSKWEPATTRALMNPEIAAAIPEENFTQAMSWFSRLGALQSMQAPEFKKVHREMETELGTRTVIEYATTAQYANDDAVINLKLLVKEASFDIYRFNFSAEILVEERTP